MTDATANSTMPASPCAHSQCDVFVIDDDISVRESVELLLRYEGFAVETFVNAQQFLDRPRSLLPNCLVLDYSLPEINGLVMQKRMTAERPEMPIIFVTGYAEVPMTIRAMKGGAVEFLTKPFSDEALLNAIRGALAHSRALFENEAETETLRVRYASLTSSERDVLALITAGMPNKLVGSNLGISEITVKAHRARVMRKMNARSLPELVRMAARLPLKRAPLPGAAIERDFDDRTPLSLTRSRC